MGSIYIDRMRILLTESCNSNCAFCFNKDMRSERHMDTDKALVLFDYLSKHLVQLKIMGGEPTIHPDFVRLYEYAQDKFPKVNLFTNAKNNKIKDITPRLGDNVTYNMNFVDSSFDFEKLLPSHNFGRYFETMVGSTTDVDKTASKIRLVCNNIKKLNIHNNIRFNVTLNCVENIFEKKEILNEKWRSVLKFIIDINPYFLNFDHCVPLCFWTKESIDFMRRNKLLHYFFSSCSAGDYGLINSSFELLHCNQHPVKAGDVFESKEKGSQIISFNRLNTLLFKENLKKMLSNLENDECINCKYAIVKCTGGCFKHKYNNKPV